MNSKSVASMKNNFFNGPALDFCNKCDREKSMILSDAQLYTAAEISHFAYLN